MMFERFYPMLPMNLSSQHGEDREQRKDFLYKDALYAANIRPGKSKTKS